MDVGYLIWGIIFILAGFGLAGLGRKFRLNVVSYTGIFTISIGVFICLAYIYSEYFFSKLI